MAASAAFFMALSMMAIGAEASLTLMLPVSEVKALLGFNSELLYVQNGDVKRNALQFPMALSQDVNHVHFAWQAEQDNKIGYAIKTSVSDSLALHQPHLNISHTGYVPSILTVWRVALPCSGVKAASAVTVHIVVTLRGLAGAGSSETLDIVRKKDCALNEGSVSKGVGMEPIEGATPPHVVFLGVVVVALIVIVLVVIGIVTLHLRRRKALKALVAAGVANKENSSNATHMHTLYETVRQHDDDGQTYIYGTEYGGGLAAPPPSAYAAPPVLPPPMMYHLPASAMAAGTSSDSDWPTHRPHGHAHMQTAPPRDPDEIMRLLEVDRLRLELGPLVQEGTFGRIYQGTLLNSDDQKEDVLVKTVVSGASVSQSQLLISEATSLHACVHHHVQTLLAATWDGTSPMLVYPMPALGNLKRWLSAAPNQPVSTHDVVHMGAQLLEALRHLHRRKVVHRDIAARNCFLGDGFLLKLCDSALSRDLFPADYHCLGDNENRPIKWMPIEAIGERKLYSKASDVWSFGVFMWELMTRAQQPFCDIDPFEMEAYLCEGFRLHQPINCPDQLYSLLASCWHADARARPSVAVLAQQVNALAKQLQQFV